MTETQPHHRQAQTSRLPNSQTGTGNRHTDGYTDVPGWLTASDRHAGRQA